MGGRIQAFGKIKTKNRAESSVLFNLVIRRLGEFLEGDILKRAEKLGGFAADGFAVDLLGGEAEAADGRRHYLVGFHHFLKREGFLAHGNAEDSAVADEICARDAGEDEIIGRRGAENTVLDDVHV